MFCFLAFIVSPNFQLHGLSKIDHELARFRGLLEKRYANDHDAGYTYIDPVTGDSTPLTPYMMKEWARAMVSIFFVVLD